MLSSHYVFYRGHDMLFLNCLWLNNECTEESNLNEWECECIPCTLHAGICRKLYSNQRGHCPHLFCCREESPLLAVDTVVKFIADTVKEENMLPENIPEREWHCHAAQHEVGDGEAHDEVVPRRPHYRLAQDGVLRGVGE